MLSPERHVGLENLVIELVESASQLTNTLHPQVSDAVSQLARSMDCYYSNLIEGHDTHPQDIERASAGHYSSQTKKRNL